MDLNNKSKENRDEEVVAVIAAVIAASMGLKIPDINIKRIRKIENSIWINTARIEQIS